jgi:predicted nucleic acid-binding protein
MRSPTETGEMADIDVVMLDATPLGKLAHPRPQPAVFLWLQRLINFGTRIIIPEIADYEVRRSFLLANLTRSIQRLDAMQTELTYQPITTAAMLRASSLWADARRQGRPTAGPKELDADVILAAQAIEAGAIVATENVGHLGRYVTALHWRDIAPP